MLTPDALATAYERHHQQLRAYVAGRVPPEAVDDVLGDVWLSACVGAATYEDRGRPVSAWLYRLAHSRSVDWWRRMLSRPQEPLQDVHAAPDALGALEAHLDARAALAGRLARLTDAQRAVVVWRFGADAPLAECAARLGRSVGAVAALQVRALERMRR